MNRDSYSGLEVRGLAVSRSDAQILEDVSFDVARGSSLAVVGPSGVGKTTLLDVLSGMLEPASGMVRFDGFELYAHPSSRRAVWRLESVGIVYQFAELLPELTLLENVQLPLLLAGQSRETSARLAESALAALSLEQLAASFPSAVSGGQRQRAAIARAVVHSPALLLADEPTGALDARTAETAADFLFDVADRCGATLVIATHNPVIAQRVDRILELGSHTPSDRALA